MCGGRPGPGRRAGGAAVSAGDSRRRREAVFGRLGGWLLGLGAFCLAMVLAARVFHPGGGGEVDSPGADSFSRSALGHRALVELVERAGKTVFVSRFAPLAELGPEVGFLVLEPPVTMDGGDLALLVSDALDLGSRVVVVLPKRRWLPDPKRPEWIADSRLVPQGEIHRMLDDLVGAVEQSLDAAGMPVAATGSLWLRRLDGDPVPGGWVVRAPLAGERPELDQAQVLVPADPDDPHGFEPLAATDAGMLVARHRQLPLVIVSDPDLVATHGLGRGDNAVLALSLLRAGGERAWVVDETVHGFERAPALFRGLLEPPLLPVTVHLGLLSLLALWLAVLRFGAPERPAPALGRGSEVLIENTARLLELGRSEPETVARYFYMSLARVAGRLGVTGEGADLCGHLALIGRARSVGDDPRRLAARVDEMIAAGGRSSPARRHSALGLARRIARWRREMTR